MAKRKGFWTGKKRPGVGVKVAAALKGRKLSKKRVAAIRNTTIQLDLGRFLPRLPKQWNGERKEYLKIHKWVRDKLGRPQVCECCGRGGLIGTKIHWANISGGYKKEIGDWERLCARCHWHKDYAKTH